MINTLIIDDEEQARKVMRNLVESEYDDLKIVGEGDDISSGIEAIR